jgi:hypothetical protein
MQFGLGLSALILINTAIGLQASAPSYQDSYKGTPYRDSRYKGGRRRFPEEWNAPSMTSVEKESLTTIQTLKIMAAAA